MLDLSDFGVFVKLIRRWDVDLASARYWIEQFSCDGGTLVLDLARLNDNYCDCEDGSDEPGTSACSHTAAAFRCANAGFLPEDLPTSRVNDGLCGAFSASCV